MVKVTRALVTGGCGFIGSALVRRLIANGIDVLNIDKRTQVANDSLDSLSIANYRLVEADLATGLDVAALLQEFKPEWIFHLAAETHVDNSIAAPLVSVTNNVLSSVRLLDGVRDWVASEPLAKALLQKIVIVSTDEVYGDSDDHSMQHQFRETDLLMPSSPYSASKSAVDQLALAWSRTFQLPLLISRCCNNYGPWQFPEKLLPKFTALALQGLPLPLYGDGLQQREWLYVEDHVDALMLLAERGKLGEIYNVGSQLLRSNRAIVAELCQLLDQIKPALQPYREQVVYVADRPGHDRCYRLNSDKLHQLGWHPKTDFNQGLRQTVHWLFANPEFLARATESPTTYEPDED